MSDPRSQAHQHIKSADTFVEEIIFSPLSFLTPNKKKLGDGIRPLLNSAGTSNDVVDLRYNKYILGYQGCAESQKSCNKDDMALKVLISACKPLRNLKRIDIDITNPIIGAAAIYKVLGVLNGYELTKMGEQSLPVLIKGLAAAGVRLETFSFGKGMQQVQSSYRSAELQRYLKPRELKIKSARHLFLSRKALKLAFSNEEMNTNFVVSNTHTMCVSSYDYDTSSQGDLDAFGYDIRELLDIMPNLKDLRLGRMGDYKAALHPMHTFVPPGKLSTKLQTLEIRGFIVTAEDLLSLLRRISKSVMTVYLLGIKIESPKSWSDIREGCRLMPFLKIRKFFFSESEDAEETDWADELQTPGLPSPKSQSPKSLSPDQNNNENWNDDEEIEKVTLLNAMTPPPDVDAHEQRVQDETDKASPTDTIQSSEIKNFEEHSLGVRQKARKGKKPCRGGR